MDLNQEVCIDKVAMIADKETLYRGFMLAQWRVEPLKGHIKAPNGTRIHIGPKAMDVLVCLAFRPGEVVERSTIFDEVWSQSPRSDEALTHCISELRHALGDRPDNPEFLHTVPKRGYRLIAAVDKLTAAALQSPPASLEPASTGFFARQYRDLRKRKVFQTVAGYPVLAWLLVQVIDFFWDYILKPLGAPGWIVPSLVVLLALGYPIAVFLTWAVDLTPEGVRVTTDDKGSTPIVGVVVLGLGSISLTIVALFFYFNAYEAPEMVVDDRAAPEIAISPFAKSIAVLRFINIGDNPAVSYIGDGLTEDLIHELTNLNTIKVAARTTIWPLSTSELPATDIMRLLGVEKLLEGSVRTEGDQVRVTAQLVGEDGFHLWSETYDRELQDILEIQKEIAVQVVDELDVLLSDEHQVRLSFRPTRSSSAYDQYLRGRQYLRLPGTPDSIASAQNHFETAIDTDNRFSLAYAGLCAAHLANYRLTRATENFTQAEMACHRALTLDGGLAEVYTALGNLYRHTGQNDKAEQEYHVALQINPMLEEATFGLGRAFQAQGRLKDAEVMLRRGIELEPGYWGAYLGMGNFLHRQGRFAESVPYYEKVTQLKSDYAGGFTNLGSALHWLGDWDKAAVAWQKSIELQPSSMGYQNMGTLRYYQHRYEDAVHMHLRAVDTAPSDHRAWGKLADAQRFVDGQQAASQDAYRRAIELVSQQLAVNPDEAEDLHYLSDYQMNVDEAGAARDSIARALALTPRNPSTWYFSALVNLGLGDEDKAIIQLEKAAELGYSLKLIANDPQFEGIGDYERFRSLIAKGATNQAP